MCVKCGQIVDCNDESDASFEVVNDQNERIWPTPPDFVVPDDWKPRSMSSLDRILLSNPPKRRGNAPTGD